MAEPQDSHVQSIIGRISKQALLSMEAETATFRADYVPRVERESDRDRITDVKLFRELVLHYFNLTAREVLKVCVSADEFESAMFNDVPRFVYYALDQLPFIAEPLKEEMSVGFSLYCMRANPWTKISDEDRDKIWHVGAITGEALTHAELKWHAEAAKLVAEGKLPSNQSASGAPGKPDSLIERRALRDSYFSAFPGEKVKVLDVCWAVRQHHCEWKRWLRVHSPLKNGTTPDLAFRAILQSGKRPSEYRSEPRPSGWK